MSSDSFRLQQTLEINVCRNVPVLMASTLAPGLLRLTPTVPSSLRLSVRCHVATLAGRHLFVGFWIMMPRIVSSASKHTRTR